MPTGGELCWSRRCSHQKRFLSSSVARVRSEAFSLPETEHRLTCLGLGSYLLWGAQQQTPRGSSTTYLTPVYNDHPSDYRHPPVPSDCLRKHRIGFSNIP